jgi:hypothetical protein
VTLRLVTFLYKTQKGFFFYQHAMIKDDQ